MKMGTRSNVQVHSRSISLPARLHPKHSLKIDAECFNLSSAAPLDGELVQNGLKKLLELYDSIEDLIHCAPIFSQQSVLRNQQKVKLVENALDASILLLDSCNSARDLTLGVKDQIQVLQSALRRKGGRDLSCMENNIYAYINFRKKSKKEISKCLRSLKKIESSIELSLPMVDIHDLDQDLYMVIKVLRESSTRAIRSFQSVLSFLSMPEKMKINGTGWSLIRKMLTPGAISEKNSLIHDDNNGVYNEVGSVDVICSILEGQIRKIGGKNDDVQRAIKRLEKLDASIKSVENGLDCLFRRLIQNRVTLLNVLTP